MIEALLTLSSSSDPCAPTPVEAKDSGWKLRELQANSQETSTHSWVSKQEISSAFKTVKRNNRQSQKFQKHGVWHD